MAPRICSCHPCAGAMLISSVSFQCYPRPCSWPGDLCTPLRRRAPSTMLSGGMARGGQAGYFPDALSHHPGPSSLLILYKSKRGIPSTHPPFYNNPRIICKVRWVPRSLAVPTLGLFVFAAFSKLYINPYIKLAHGDGYRSPLWVGTERYPSAFL